MDRKIISGILRIGIALFLFASCGTTNMDGPPIDASSATQERYLIGPEDVLRIIVWKQPDISVTVPVRSDGKISVPLVNDIQAAGLTPEELQKEIVMGLDLFIENPTVSVIVEAINSLKITISGNVNAPGVYKIGRNISLLEAISLAGGLSGYADPKRIRILRRGNGDEQLFEVNYKAAIEGTDMTQNITVFSGDSIIVP